MISVVLIDDEYFFRQSLRKNIPWRELGFYIIGEASNGREGFELIAKYKPDVVFLDINMPVMDGFDLCEELCQVKIYPKIIFLTGYEEFSYAKLAIQYGAKNYLLKPIDPQEVKDTLIKLAEEYYPDNQDHEDEKLQNPQYLIALRQKYLLELLTGRLHRGASINDTIRFLKLDPHASHYCSFVIRLEHPVTPGNSLASQFLAAITYANDMFEQYTHCFGLSENLIVGIFALESNDTSPIATIAAHYIEQINAHLFSNVTAAIGSVKPTISEISASYADSLDALCNRFLSGDNCVLDYETIYSQEYCNNIITPQINEQIQHALLYFDVRMFSDIVKRIFDMFQECDCTFRCVQNSCASIISLVLSTYRTQVPKEFSKLLGTGISAELAVHFNSIDELKELLISTLSEHIKAARKQSAPVIPDRIEKIKIYILENLSDPSLNIDSISKQFYISYHHLCSTFKKQVGITINDYILDRRMEMAKELIEHKVTHIAYIASMVGFNDANYFSRCFKKRFGCSPSKYYNHNE